MAQNTGAYQIETTTSEKVTVKYQAIGKVFTDLLDFVHNNAMS